jgi:hypothetical protein
MAFPVGIEFHWPTGQSQAFNPYVSRRGSLSGLAANSASMTNGSLTRRGRLAKHFNYPKAQARLVCLVGTLSPSRPRCA